MSRNPCTFCNHLQLLVHINTPRMLSSQEPGQLTLVKCAISFSFPKSLFQLCFFSLLSQEILVWRFCEEFKAFKITLQKPLVSSMFSFAADRCWGLGDIYSLPVLSFVRWLLPPWSNTIGKTEATWVQEFQFISPRVTAVVGSATLVNQIVPA